MSTYAVFGMTRHHANDIARKRVDKRCLKSSLVLSEAEDAKRVQEESDAIMKSSQSVRLSPMYDAPQFAEQFRDIARKSESRHLCIRAHVRTLEKTKTGRYKYVWEPV